MDTSTALLVWFRDTLAGRPEGQSRRRGTHCGNALRGSAEIVTDGEETQRVSLQILHNCGFAALLVGLNPFTLTDEKIMRKRGPEIVVRIRPER